MADENSNWNSLSALDKLKKTRIDFGDDNLSCFMPFFSYLTMHLNFIEKKDLMKHAPGGIGINKHGDLIFDPSYVNGLTKEEARGVLAHEICLTPESLVLTSDGLKPISEIKIGDLIYDDKGKFSRVNKIMCKHYEGKVYTIKGRFGLPTTFTDNHPILSLNTLNYRRCLGFAKSYMNSRSSNDKFKFINAKDIRKNDALMIGLPRDIVKKPLKIMKTRDSYIYKQVYLDKDIAYFLGFFVGDGSLHKVKHSGCWFKSNGKTERNIALTLSVKDDKDKLMRIIKKKFYRSPCCINIKGKNAIRITFSSKSLAKFLRREFYNGKEKKIPNWMLYQTHEITKSFVNGLRDADGHIIDNGRTSITNTATGVYSFLPILLLKLGHIPAFSKWKRKYPYKDAYTVAYETVKGKRKTGVLESGRFIMPVDKITESNYKGMVYNLETESHMFCTPFFIVHNCHVVFEHFDRSEERKEHPLLANIAHDIVVNNIIIQEKMTLPSGGSIPANNQITVFGYQLKKIDEKCSEEIYDELHKHLGDLYNKVKSKMDDRIKQDKKGFDVHMESDDKDKSKKGKKDEKMKEKGWEKILVDACTYARERGKLPGGIERMVDRILDTSIDWREILYRYITDQIPVDYSWSRPSKKSYALGVYLPRTEKESIDVLVAVDTSGSISQDELEQFMSEILGITNSFSNVDLTIIDCDADIHGIYPFKHATADDVMSKVKLKGGGGTDHRPVFAWISQNKSTAKFIICFTDGCTSFPNASSVGIRTLWVVAGDYRLGAKDFPFGEVIELPKRN